MIASGSSRNAVRGGDLDVRFEHYLSTLLLDVATVVRRYCSDRWFGGSLTHGETSIQCSVPPASPVREKASQNLLHDPLTLASRVLHGGTASMCVDRNIAVRTLPMCCSYSVLSLRVILQSSHGSKVVTYKRD